MKLSELLDKGGHVLDKQRGGKDAAPKREGGPDRNPPVRSEQEQERERTTAQPVSAPWADHPVQNGVYEGIPEAILKAAKQLEIPVPETTAMALQAAARTLGEVFARIADPSDQKEGVWQTVRQIAHNLGVVAALDDNYATVLRRRYDKTAKLLWHSVNTALVAVDLYPHIENPECSAQEMGAAALLHDAGFLLMRTRNGFGWDPARPEFLEHIAKGVQVSDLLRAPDVVKLMIAQHHERLDGTGLPHRISGSDFRMCSQVLGLAETFERIIAEANGGGFSELPADNFMPATLQQYARAYDPAILKALIGLHGFYPDGTMVELTNRSICRVLKQNQGHPLRPIVQVVVDSAGNHPDEASVVDLRVNKMLSVMRAVTHRSDSGKKSS